MNWYDDNLDLMALGEHLVDTFDLHTARRKSEHRKAARRQWRG